MDVLNGKNLKKADGSSAKWEDVMANKKVVAFYFSAHWCPPCRQFTPTLKDFYSVRILHKNDKIIFYGVLSCLWQECADLGVEIVFVSSDRSPDDMVSYMKESHGDW